MSGLQLHLGHFVLVPRLGLLSNSHWASHSVYLTVTFLMFSRALGTFYKIVPLGAYSSLFTHRPPCPQLPSVFLQAFNQSLRPPNTAHESTVSPWAISYTKSGCLAALLAGYALLSVIQGHPSKAVT